jgi:hypothetical protein
MSLTLSLPPVLARWYENGPYAHGTRQPDVDLARFQFRGGVVLVEYDLLLV